jgi:amino acid permease
MSIWLYRFYLSLLGAVLGLIVVAMSVNLASQLAATVGVFFAGWGCCYNGNQLLGDTKRDEQSKERKH